MSASVMTPNTSQLSIDQLAVSYDGVEALAATSLRLEAGQIVTIIGPNGAGKSSLLNAMAGALPPNGASRGRVTLNGCDLSALPVETRVAHGLCLVPEKRELFGSMRVEDNLLLGSYARRSDTRDQRETAMDDVYKLFPRLRERRHSEARTLSGGERQMLALGRALMSQPCMLLLDEPSLGLAPLIVKEIFDIIRALRDRGVGIVLVEQNARAALRLADHAYVLETGRVELSGPAAELLHDARIAATYLGQRPPA